MKRMASQVSQTIIKNKLKGSSLLPLKFYVIGFNKVVGSPQEYIKSL
jgi:hypothetical protein